jgi:hypothetical protein
MRQFVTVPTDRILSKNLFKRICTRTLFSERQSSCDVDSLCGLILMAKQAKHIKRAQKCYYGMPWKILQGVRAEVFSGRFAQALTRCVVFC